MLSYCCSETINNADLISAGCILIVDIVYVVGMWLPDIPLIASISYFVLCLLGYIALPFSYIAIKKKIGDLMASEKYGLWLLSIWNFMLLGILIEGVVFVIVFSVAGLCIMLNYTDIYSTIFAIYVPIGWINIGITIIKNITSFVMNMVVAYKLKKLDDDAYMDIYRIYTDDIAASSVCIGVTARSIMDPASWFKMISMVEEKDYTFVKDHLQKNIKIQYGISIVDLCLNLMGDICMGLCRVYPYTKLQACLYLGMAILYDIRLLIKKTLQCIQRCCMKDVENYNEIASV